MAALLLGPDGLVYGGSGSTSANGHLFRFAPWDPGAVADLGIPLLGSLEVGSLALLDGLIYAATGDQYTLFSYDPVLGKLTTVGQVPDIAEITCMTAGPGGKLYGGDYPGGKLWVFNLSTGQGSVLGQPVPGETAINAVVAGPDGNIYGGTGSLRGQFFVYDLGLLEFEVLGSPVWRDSRIGALIAAGGGQIYGGTGSRRGLLFRFEPANRPYSPDGTAVSTSISPRMKDKTYVPGTSEVWALALDAQGWLYASGYSASGDAKLSRWDPATGGLMEIVGVVPGDTYAVFDLILGPDGLLYGGGGSWYGPVLFSYDPSTELLTQIPMGLATESQVSALVRCPNGLLYGGTAGGDTVSGQLFSYDPGSGAFLYYGQVVPGETSIESLACSPDGTIYGGTYPSAHLFSFQSLGAFADLGQPVPGETSLSAVAWGADGMVYGGTVGNGHVFRHDPATQAVSDLGRPSASDTEIWALEASPDGLLFGATGGTEGHLFSYDPAAEHLADLGRVYHYERFVFGLAIDSSGQTIYLGTGWNYGEMVAFERAYRFGWLDLSYSANLPENTSLSVDVLDTSGSLLAAGVPPGGSLLGISAPDIPAIQLRAVLGTGDPGRTPQLLDWTVHWTEDPIMAVTPPALGFFAPSGGPDPAEKTLSVTNTSGGDLEWSLTQVPSWLEADPLSGTAPADLEVTAHAGVLPAGVYTGTLLFEGGVDCRNCPVEVPVTLTVGWRVHLPLACLGR